ncbi:MAG: hypothetical protein N2112_13370 [Gemmataceae bacterium]|jgi:hypothetical protein|nr:hypothetical protein [Gemmataceae bacterium]
MSDLIQSYADISEEQKKEIAAMIKLEPKEKLVPPHKSLFQEREEAAELRGQQIGQQIGQVEALHTSIAKILLKRFGESLTTLLMPKIQALTDVSQLDALFDAVLSEPWEQFQKKLG